MIRLFEKNGSLKHEKQYGSKCLIFATIPFFLCHISHILILIYSSALSVFIDNNIPQCFLDGAPDLKAPGVNCIMKENIESVLQLLKRLQPILTRKAISKICENSNEKPYLTDADIVKMFTNEKVVG